MQAGAFQPFFRGHAHLDTKRRYFWITFDCLYWWLSRKMFFWIFLISEPWLFGDPWTSHIRKAIRTRCVIIFPSWLRSFPFQLIYFKFLRYSYLPYWYTLFREGSLNGLPMMRPLWMEFPADSSIFGIPPLVCSTALTIFSRGPRHLHGWQCSLGSSYCRSRTFFCTCLWLFCSFLSLASYCFSSS